MEARARLDTKTVFEKTPGYFAVSEEVLKELFVLGEDPFLVDKLGFSLFLNHLHNMDGSLTSLCLTFFGSKQGVSKPKAPGHRVLGDKRS
jgi:hypothetical protein